MTTGSTVLTLPPIVYGRCGTNKTPSYKLTKSWSGADQVGPGLDPHSYSMSLTEYTDGVIRELATGYLCGWTQAFGSPPYLSLSTWGASDDLKLLDRLRSQMAGSDFNGSVFFGTAKQSFRLIENRTKRVTAGLRSLVRGGSKRDILRSLATGAVTLDRKLKGLPFRENARGHIQDISQIWLEVSYGWLPLLSDIYEGTRAVANLQERTYRRRFVARYTRSTGVRTVSQSGASYSCLSRNRGQLIYTVTMADDPITQLTLLGLLDPLSLTWELIPYSFVVDWFLPVGSYLESLAFFPRFKGDWVKSVKRERRGTSSASLNAAWTMQLPAKAVEVNFSRYVGSGSLGVPLPRFKSPLSPDWRRAVNAVALVGVKL